MDENQQHEIERRVNDAVSSCRNCPGRSELEQMQRNFHTAAINLSSPFDLNWPQGNGFDLPARCTNCYLVENELATDE